MISDDKFKIKGQNKTSSVVFSKVNNLTKAYLTQTWPSPAVVNTLTMDECLTQPHYK